MAVPDDVTLPFGWTLFYGTGIVLVLAAVIFGVIWTLTHSGSKPASEKTAWVILQLLLPIVGFVIWLAVTTAAKPPTPRKI